MGLAIVLAFVAGLITAVSPCVLPVLPIVLAGGVAGGENRRRPFAIIAGLALSFFVSVLFATWILDKLGLPKDLLRNISIGAALPDRRDADRPPGRRPGSSGRSRASRAGPRATSAAASSSAARSASSSSRAPAPALAYVTCSAASGEFGLKAILVTIAYTVGFSIVLLAIALGGRRSRAGAARRRRAVPRRVRRHRRGGRLRARLQPRRRSSRTSRSRRFFSCLEASGSA